MSDRQTELLELLDESGTKLFALLTRLTLREDAAEELMQDLFVRLSGAHDQGGVDCWYAYARRTAINLAFDWRRRQANRARLFERLPERSSEQRAPLGSLIASEEIEQVLAAVDRLRGPSREVFVLRYIQEESYEDIARQVGRTVHQVRALCFRAMSKLRTLLGAGAMAEGEKGVQRVQS